MPVILRLTFEDDSQETIRLPAEVWVRDAKNARTSVLSEKILQSVELDPHRETADTNRDNNYFPPRLEPSRFQIYKAGERSSGDNPMRAANRRAEAEKKKKEEEAAKAKAAEAKSSEKDSAKDDAKGKTEKEPNRE